MTSPASPHPSAAARRPPSPPGGEGRCEPTAAEEAPSFSRSGRRWPEGPDEGLPAAAPLQRAKGTVRVSYRVTAGASRLATLHQAGCLKLRFPRAISTAADAVLVNTAGGLAGGDDLATHVTLEAGAALTVTTQACERVYRSTGPNATVATRITLAPDADLAYLPQETILFDGGRLSRRLDLDVAGTARFLLCESVILGREAMGESVGSGLLADRWRIRIDGRLAYADDLKLSGDIAGLGRRAATLAGNSAFATLLARHPALEARLPAVRALLGPTGGASLVGGCLVVRLLALDGQTLRRRLVPIIAAVSERPLPRLWSL